MRTALIFIATALVWLLAACSGGGGGNATPGGTTPPIGVITLFYPDGTKQAEGPGYRAADNRVVRHGAWTDWFNTGEVHLTGTYVQGLRSDRDPWVEYNPDTSVRFDWTDY